MPTAIAGKGSRGMISGTPVFFDRWKVTHHTIDIPTTSFEDQVTTAPALDPRLGETFETGIAGPQAADIEASGYYDADLPPYNPAVLFLWPGVKGTPQRSTVTNIAYTACALAFGHTKTGVTINTNCGFGFPSIRTIQQAIDVDVNGRVNFAFSAKSNGGFVVPLA